KAGGDCRRTDEHQEETRRYDLGNQQQDAGDRPNPAGFQVETHHPSIRLTPGTEGVVPRPALTWLDLVGAPGDVEGPLPRTSFANSPIPPSVPINWVASIGKRIVLAFGDVAKRLIASTYFCAM